MQAIIFMGIQASGKSTYYWRNFFNSHVRISMDLLNTRNRERLFLQSCLQTQAAFVVDNTNPTLADRQRYIPLAKERQYEVVGYFFETSLKAALRRNSFRTGKARIPEVGVRACLRKLERPSFSEGFDKLYRVRLEGNQYVVSDWEAQID
ncbi:AAA family ATPase [Pontibacter sp. G13]|uniref:AAA family ATPase n=1 Tax=Pontibacter sp. G13 TaxID=3074898 RepID=UPI00288B2351|nr:ATP-binding protein [Pontibacter sp. G13]WNJ18352.1 ATP-binding protein [Pontibacter sp. G13]